MTKTLSFKTVAIGAMLLATTDASAQLVSHERLFSFEDAKLPVCVSAKHSRLALTTDHYKDGSQALSWRFKPRAVLSIRKDLQFEPLDPTGRDTYLSGFVVWVYSPEAMPGKKLRFDFLKQGDVCCGFDMGLDFRGWRAAWVCYERDMEGTPQLGMDEVRLTAPDVAGSLCIDHLLTAAKMDHRHQTADLQVPFVNAGVTNHWLQVLRHSRLTPDEPLPEAVSDAQRADMALLESRLRELIYQPSPLTETRLATLRKAYAAYGLMRNTDGSTKGLPISFGRAAEAYERILPDYHANLFTVNKMELKGYFELMNRVAIAWNDATDEATRDELRTMFLLMYDHAVDQGIAYGSCLGNFTHYGYSFRGFYTALMLMKPVLRATGRLEGAEQAMRWYAMTNEVFVVPDVAGMDMDSFNTTTTGRIASILMMEDSPLKVAYLRAFSRWINNGCLPAEGLAGAFKRDGAAFHHCNLYPAYAVGGLNGATNMIYLLSGTSFAVSPEAHQTVRNVLLAMRFYCHTTQFPLALSGRHPDGKGALVPFHFGLMALASEPGGAGGIDRVMGDAYLRLAGEAPQGEQPEYQPTVASAREAAVRSRIIAAGCRAESTPQGSLTLGYGCTSVYRQGNWSAVVRGHSRYIWAAEHYRGENLYGRYLAHASLQLLSNGQANGDVTLASCGWQEAGFDWSRIPGATAVRLPLERMKADVLNVDTYSGFEEMLLSDETFAGGLTHDGRYGAFGMKLHEHDKYEGSLRARKSYHFLGDRIVCLGSDICCHESDFDTETTLFQLTMPADSVRHYWSNPTVGQGWWLDHLGTGYCVSTEQGFDQARLELHPQQQSASNEGVPGTGDWATLTINHGRAPQGRAYRYAILPQTSADRLQRFAEQPDYTVLRQDSVAHIVRDAALGLTSYVLFESASALPNGPVAAVDTACLVMTETPTTDALSLTVANPDLALYRGAADERLDADGKRIERSIYSRPWKFDKSLPIPVRITLRGCWQLADTDTDTVACRVVASTADTTVLEFTCCEAASFGVRLTRRE